MPPITVSAEVNRSAEEVFAYATDPNRFSEWQKGVARLTIALAFEGHGIGRLLVPLVVERQARREMPVNLAALKIRLEASHHGENTSQA
jgi:hypothetical protein